MDGLFINALSSSIFYQSSSFQGLRKVSQPCKVYVKSVAFLVYKNNSKNIVLKEILSAVS